MRRLAIVLLCAACQALLLSTGCGGGKEPTPDAGTPYVPPPVPDAGSPDAGSKPDAGPLDLIPPTVLTYSPADGAIAVAPETSIVVTFSEAMQTDRGLLQLSPGTGLPNGGLITAVPQDWDTTRHTVKFAFPSGLPLKTKLTATLGDFGDLAGNAMRGYLSFSFTVSDGLPPQVLSTSPTEGASNVALTTSEITVQFNVPMDTSVGTLTPGGGLTLGAAAWTGNQVIKAPITSTLVNNGIYSVRLDNFRNTIGKALDPAPYIGDGKLDFGTGPDTIPPTVRDSSPAEGATGLQFENVRFIVITFSEPMDTTVGKAELVNGTTRTVLTPTWSSDGFTATYPSEYQLPPGKTLQVALTGFKDKAGNALNLTTYLGSNGVLDFTMAPDTVKPYVTDTNVPDGATDVYPVEVYVVGGNPAVGYRKVFTFQFSEPMDASATLVTLHEALNPNSYRNLAGVWSADRLTLTVTIYPVSSGQLPLLADTPYYLDLTALKDPSGNPLDATIPVLGNGRLDFRTLLNQTDLNQACGYALTQVPLAVTATASVTSSTPRVDQLHTLYELTLPSNGTSYSGVVRAQLVTNETQPIFMNGQVPLKVTNPQSPSTGIGVTLVPVPPACPAITYEATFGTPVTPELQLSFGPYAQSPFRLVLESSY